MIPITNNGTSPKLAAKLHIFHETAKTFPKNKAPHKMAL